MGAPRTPREKWIGEGLRALADGGPDAVRVETLARALGVTKGGFYGYFADRSALLEEMLDRWERSSVDEIVERVEGGEPGTVARMLARVRGADPESVERLLERVEGREGEARAKVLRVVAISLFDEELLRIDLAVRDWARRDGKVARRLRRVDNRRMDYVRSLFAQFCPDERDVEVRCLLAFSVWVGNHFIAADHGARSRVEVLVLAALRVTD